jgi:hypothetical protein
MENDPAVLDVLLETESWQTLATFARESARTFLYTSFYGAPRVKCHCAYLFFLYYSTTTSTTRARRTAGSYHG